MLILFWVYNSYGGYELFLLYFSLAFVCFTGGCGLANWLLYALFWFACWFGQWVCCLVFLVFSVILFRLFGLLTLEAHLFLVLFWVFIITYIFLSFGPDICHLLFRNFPNLISLKFIQSKFFVMRIYLKYYICDVLVNIILYGFDPSRMFCHKLSHVEYFVLIEDIASATSFAPEDPLINRMFFHLMCEYRR